MAPNDTRFSYLITCNRWQGSIPSEYAEHFGLHFRHLFVAQLRVHDKMPVPGADVAELQGFDAVFLDGLIEAKSFAPDQKQGNHITEVDPARFVLTFEAMETLLQDVIVEARLVCLIRFGDTATPKAERPGRRSVPGFAGEVLPHELIAFFQESRVIALAGSQFPAGGCATACVRLDLRFRHRPPPRPSYCSRCLTNKGAATLANRNHQRRRSDFPRKQAARTGQAARTRMDVLATAMHHLRSHWPSSTCNSRGTWAPHPVWA